MWRSRTRRITGAAAGAALALGWVAAAPAGAQPAAAATGGLPAAAVAQGRIAAVVNDDIVSGRELQARIGLAILVSSLPDDAETRRRLAPQVLRGLVDERLQLQAAKRLRLDVTPAEVDRAVADVARRNGMSDAQLARLVAERGLDVGVVREQLRAQIAWFKVIGREVRPKVVVTRDQVEAALRTAAVAAGRPGGGATGAGPGGAGDEVLLSELLVPVYDTDGEAAVLAQAADLAASVRGGADFAALARQLSAAPSAEAGGDLGWVRLAALTPELREAVAGLGPGQISAPVRSPAGVHLLGVRDRRAAAGPAAAPFPGAGGGDRDAVRGRLEDEQLQRLAARYLRELRRSAFIDVRI